MQTATEGDVSAYIHQLNENPNAQSICSSFIYHRQLHRAPSSLSNMAETPANPPHLSSHTPACTRTHTHTKTTLSPSSLHPSHTLTHTPLSFPMAHSCRSKQNGPDAVVVFSPWTKEIRWPYWDPIDTHTLSYTHNSSVYQSQSMCSSEWEVNKDLVELLHWLVIGTLGLFDYM